MTLSGAWFVDGQALCFSAHAVQDYAEEEEICTLQVTELKEAEKRLQVEGELLERRKLLHIRELKRSRDERASQYHRHL